MEARSVLAAILRDGRSLRDRPPQSLTQNVTRFSSPRETAGEEANAGDHDPGLGAGDGRLEVLGEATVASKPSQRAFDHPSLGLSFEGSDALGSSDDLNDPFAQVGKRAEQFGPAIDAISKDVAQLGEASTQRSQERHSAVIVLDIGGMDQQREQQSLRVRDDVALAALHLLRMGWSGRAPALPASQTGKGQRRQRSMPCPRYSTARST